MNTRDAQAALWFVTLTLAACGERTAPDRLGAPAFELGGEGRPSVLVNPNADENGTAKTIQEGIGMVAEGGTVLVLPGSYSEAIVVDKGLTLEGIGGESEPVVIAPLGNPQTAIRVTTPNPVVLRNLTVLYGGGLPAPASVIRGFPVGDLTVERTTVVGVNPPGGITNLVAVVNDAPTTARGRLVVRESFLDGTIPPLPLSATFPQAFGIRVGGDVDAVLERNVIRRTGGACIIVTMRNDFGGHMDVNIVGNDLDECYPLSRAASILVGPINAPTGAVTATGVVNIVGNTIRNSSGSCFTTSAINYEFYTGVIERNGILGVVQACAFASPRGLPAGIWVGSIRGLPPATPLVRLNDIDGNAHAGLRVGPNMNAAMAINATCNWWGSPSGPSGAGPGAGDAIIVEGGAPTPDFLPFAAAPIAGTTATSC